MTIVYSSDRLAALCAADGEFMIAARFWTGGVRFEIGDQVVGFKASAGELTSAEPAPGDPGVIVLHAPMEIWDLLLAPAPPRLTNDIANLIGGGVMALHADPVLYAQYYPAVMRAVELMRGPGEPSPAPGRSAPTTLFDSPVGRYIHLNLQGQDHRVYFEEAGVGIPMILQHTAGCHGSQWRHLFECPAITDHFRLIAYDLPFHGKSLPPVGPSWWSETYKLTAPFLRSVPLALAAALDLQGPVFMGCSVGGVLALDLARHHPDAFRAVISLEGALKIDQDISALSALWHPQVSNEFKARLMNALMSPTSPEAFRKETSQVYAAGWPPVFLGDLNYYLCDYDLRTQAAEIDTGKVGVHILSGEYDASGTLELGKAAHAAIPGSTWSGMNGVGHFPMSENPEVFIAHLLPVLEAIKTRRWASPKVPAQ